MAYKDLLVCVDSTPDSQERVKLAITMARAHGARLTGLDVSSDSAFLGDWRDQALQAPRDFESLAKAAEIETRLVGCEYRRESQTLDPTHYVDLIIAPRPTGVARDLVQSFVPDDLLLKSGAPSLIIPAAWTFRTMGENVVVAWNGSREAARAVHDALPILQQSRKVVVFAFSSKPSPLRASAEALIGHLGRHGVNAVLSDWTNTGDTTAIEALFASLDTQDCDLIVAGGFGHSRIFEGLFGGVSVNLMNQPILPVLLSH